MDSDLKAVQCRCGGEAIVKCMTYDRIKYYVVECTECGLQTPLERSENKAIEIWNESIPLLQKILKGSFSRQTAKIKKYLYSGTSLYDIDGECSECGKYLDASWEYCPSCGAKLEWEKWGIE